MSNARNLADLLVPGETTLQTVAIETDRIILNGTDGSASNDGSKILFEEGEQALAATKRSEVNLSLEKVVEANTLLSGVGFESGGLAGAHGFAHGYTHIPIVEERYLHGEMVAMGVQAQLMMEKDVFEADRVAKFFARVGLPVCLSQVSLSRFDNAALNSVVESALGYQRL